MKLSKQGTKFQAIVVILARGHGELVQGTSSLDSDRGYIFQYILKAVIAVFSGKLDTKYESKRRNER